MTSSCHLSKTSWKPIIAQMLQNLFWQQHIIRFMGVCVYRALQWRHNGRNSVSNHQPHDCFLNRLFRRRSKKTSKLRVTSLCAHKWPVMRKKSLHLMTSSWKSRSGHLYIQKGTGKFRLLYSLSNHRTQHILWNMHIYKSYNKMKIYFYL